MDSEYHMIKCIGLSIFSIQVDFTIMRALYIADSCVKVYAMVRRNDSQKGIDIGFRSVFDCMPIKSVKNGIEKLMLIPFLISNLSFTRVTLNARRKYNPYMN